METTGLAPIFLTAVSEELPPRRSPSHSRQTALATFRQFRQARTLPTPTSEFPTAFSPFVSTAPRRSPRARHVQRCRTDQTRTESQPVDARNAEPVPSSPHRRNARSRDRGETARDRAPTAQSSC